MTKQHRSYLAANISALAGLVSTIASPIKTKIAARNHIAHLRSKYPETTVQRMLSEKIWQGQAAQELIDSLGNPAAVDRKMLATRSREIWKYYPSGANRYRLRVTLDDGVVATWDSKT